MNFLKRASTFLILLTAVAAMAFSLGGCSGIPVISNPSKKEPRPATPAAPKATTQVRADGKGFALGDVEQSSLSSQQFADRVEELLKAKRSTEARRWIRRFPDVAIAVLRDPTSVRISTDALTLAAEVHDQQCSHVGKEAGWTAVVLDRSSQPKKYLEYDQTVKDFMSRLQAGNTQEALALNITATPPGTSTAILKIEAYRLNGIGLVLAERPKEAVVAFENALQLARDAHPYQTANLLLLLSDAQRRAGDAQAADGSWHTAIQLASELAVASTPVTDPILWEHAAYLRPVNTAWPKDVLQRLAEAQVAFGIASSARDAGVSGVAPSSPSDECLIWTCIGYWRLSRDESQAALVALKRAESTTSDHYVAGRLRLAEAKALMKLGQSSAATGMLVAIAGDSDPRVSRPATAVLGTCKLQQGSTQQGFNLLHRAVEQDPTMQWPDRAEAEADLGLAYLLNGDEEAGLRWLHSAQQSFEAAGQYEQLVQCLENEAAYLEQAKKGDLAKTVRKRVATVQVM